MLELIMNTTSPSGNENKMRDLIKEKITNPAAVFKEDAMGNLIVNIKGSGKKIMITSAMDEDGLVVLDKKEDVAHFGVLGDAKAYPMTKLKFSNGKRAVLNAKDTQKPFENQTGILFNQDINIGDVCAYQVDCLIGNNKIFGKNIGNRVGVFAMINAIENLKSENDLYFVFAAQGRLGNRGLKTASYAIKPQYALVLEEVQADENISLGKGVVLKLASKGAVASADLKEYFLENVKQKQISIDVQKKSAISDIQSIEGGISCMSIGVASKDCDLIAQTASMQDVEQLSHIVLDFVNNF